MSRSLLFRQWHLQIARLRVYMLATEYRRRLHRIDNGEWAKGFGLKIRMSC
jgi:hypothetical protein